MPAVSSIIAGVSAAAAVAGGVAKIASGGPERPKAAEPFPLTSEQRGVAGQLASSFNSFSQQGGPVTGVPTLGQGLTGGPLNSPTSLRERLNSVGRDLNGLMGPRPAAAPQMPNTPPRNVA